MISVMYSGMAETLGCVYEVRGK